MGPISVVCTIDDITDRILIIGRFLLLYIDLFSGSYISLVCIGVYIDDIPDRIFISEHFLQLLT